MSKLITDDCVSSLVNNHIGKTDISDIGDGTVTGAIKTLDAKIKYTEIITQLSEFSYVRLTERFNFTPKNTLAAYVIDGLPDTNVVGIPYTYNGMLFLKVQDLEGTASYANYQVRIGVIYLEN